jgi:hypothetical protein
MKKFLLALSLLPFVLLANLAQFDFIRAKSLGEDVMLEWSMKEESNIDYFMIQKKIEDGSKDSYIYISSRIDSEGNNSFYQYTDEDSFYSKQQKDKFQSESIKSYRIEATTNSGEKIYSDDTYVTQNVSSVRKTWGMLKEMFR